MRPVDLEWTGAEVLPQLAGVGLKRFARIEALDPLNKMLLGKAQETTELLLPFGLRSFADVRPGPNQWLRSSARPRPLLLPHQLQLRAQGHLQGHVLHRESAVVEPKAFLVGYAQPF